MENERILEPNTKNLIAFLKKGYSFREVVFKGIEVKLFSRLVSLIRYPLRQRGKNVDIDYRAVIDGSRFISIGDGAFIQRGAWLVVPLFDMEDIKDRAYLYIGNRVRIGPNCTIAAANNIRIEDDVLFGPNCSVLDHFHKYQDILLPISKQGIGSKGGVVIKRGAWLGANAVVYSAKGDLTVGEHSIVAANSFVRESVPDFTMVAGNPARQIMRYDSASGEWQQC